MSAIDLTELVDQQLVREVCPEKAKEFETTTCGG
jgi:hypothetical protein